MAITKNVARQELIVARVTGTFGTGYDVPLQAVYPAIEIPQNAVVVGGHLVVDDVTSASVVAAVGDGLAGTRYGSSISCNALALTALVPTGYKYTVQDTIDITISGATPAAYGTFELVVEYIVDGRAEFSQG
jgi:hypothetical protein